MASTPPASGSTSLSGLDEDRALRAILEGTAGETGRDFFEALVRNLASALGVHAAMMTEYDPTTRRLRTLGFCQGEQWIDEYEYAIAGTPCELVIEGATLIHVPDEVQDRFPGDDDLKKFEAVSYLGLPFTDDEGQVLGHLAVLDRRPMPPEPRGLAVFRIFAARAGAEMRRIRAEEATRQREQRFARLLASAMDGVIEMDRDMRITMLNPAAQKLLDLTPGAATGLDVGTLLSPGSREKLERLMRELEARTTAERSTWIPGGLQVVAGGEPVPAEATLSCYEIERTMRHTLIIRDLNERLEAERRIETLTAEAEYLRSELSETHDVGDIIGRSEALRRVLADVKQVAGTGATVLLLGETGTGKELFARAIHAASGRADHPLVKVNCAAIPESLIESEFFGHEKGAFTGATQRREGRFALADKGTIFLDEIGELPLDLQSKLLRVLQEGEFEPVGSSRTRHVDVRVVAATNRDLEQAVRDGTFREDLFYRLNVFPIRLPPLRERPEDVPLLAEAFVRRFASRMARVIEPLSEAGRRRLAAYPWPGNVRELENVIERAVITSTGGTLNLERALPETTGAAPPQAPPPPTGVRTAAELQEMERASILAALDRCAGKVAGANGAARLMGMPPSTLTSRMKALGIRRP